jgi:hypothetical protein
VPIDFSLSLELDVLVARWHGDVDLQQYREGFAAYLDHEDYALGRPELCDLSGVKTLDADFKQIWSIVTMVNNQASGAPVNTCCSVYAPQDVMFGVARMYQSVADSTDGVQVAVFREQAEALAHLHLPSPTVDGLFDVATFRPVTTPDGQTP